MQRQPAVLAGGSRVEEVVVGAVLQEPLVTALEPRGRQRDAEAGALGHPHNVAFWIERAFLDHIVTSTLAFEGEGRVTEYVGGWEDYLRQSASRAPVTPAVERPARPQQQERSSSDRDSSRRKLSYKEQRELEALPGHIEALETEQQRLRHESESPDFYREGADHIRAVLARLEALGPELEAALARWVELEERT